MEFKIVAQNNEIDHPIAKTSPNENNFCKIRAQISVTIRENKTLVSIFVNTIEFVKLKMYDIIISGQKKCTTSMISNPKGCTTLKCKI